MTLSRKQFRWFHGGPGGIEGTLTPANPGTGRSMDEMAFATNRVGDAMVHAAKKSAQAGRLFGSVYEVNPRNPMPSPLGDPRHVASVEGMDVVKHTGFVDHEGKWMNL